MLEIGNAIAPTWTYVSSKFHECHLIVRPQDSSFIVHFWWFKLSIPPQQILPLRFHKRCQGGSWNISPTRTWLEWQEGHCNRVYPISTALMKYSFVYTVQFRSIHRPCDTMTQVMKFSFRHLPFEGVTRSELCQVSDWGWIFQHFLAQFKMEHRGACHRWNQIYPFMDTMPKFRPKLPQWGLSHFLTVCQDPLWHRDSAHISAHQVPPVMCDRRIDQNCTVCSHSKSISDPTPRQYWIGCQLWKCLDKYSIMITLLSSANLLITVIEYCVGSYWFIGTQYNAVCSPDSIGYCIFDVGKIANDLISIGHIVYMYVILIRRRI
jgi:hypothetical protein